MRGIAKFRGVAIPTLAEFEANPSDYEWHLTYLPAELSTN